MVKEGFLNQEQLSNIQISLNKGNSGDTVYNTWALITLESWFKKYLI